MQPRYNTLITLFYEIAASNVLWHENKRQNNGIIEGCAYDVYPENKARTKRGYNSDYKVFFANDEITLLIQSLHLSRFSMSCCLYDCVAERYQ